MARFVFLVAGWLLAASAFAQYPERQVRIVVPYPASGAVDFVTRLIAERLTARWKQPVIVDNRPGATGVIGVQAVLSSPPDGYTLLMHATAGLTIYPALAKAPAYDTLRDLTPIAPVAYSVLIAVVNPSLGSEDMRSFLEYAKKNPGKLAYGSAGIGALNHIGTELLKMRAGIDLAHVPYKGDAPVVADLLNGNVAFALLSSNVALPHVRSGKLRALAVTSRVRAEAAPQLPTMMETGLADFDLKPWNGLLGPAGMPAAIVQQVNAALADVVMQPDVRRKLADLGFSADSGSPAGMAERIRAETAMWRDVIRRAGISSD